MGVHVRRGDGGVVADELRGVCIGVGWVGAVVGAVDLGVCEWRMAI
jgi:hypothetical protein